MEYKFIMQMTEERSKKLAEMAKICYCSKAELINQLIDSMDVIVKIPVVGKIMDGKIIYINPTEVEKESE